MGRGDFTKIPNGIPSVEDRVHLLYTHGVATGRIDLHRFVDVGFDPGREAVRPVSAQRARFSRAPTPTWSSSIRNYRGVISASTQQMNVDYSAFEGWPIEGRADVVTVRGQVQVRGGKFVGAHDHGRMLRREPTHGERSAMPGMARYTSDALRARSATSAFSPAPVHRSAARNRRRAIRGRP